MEILLTLHSRNWAGQTRWKFQIRYFFKWSISSFNFHFDVLVTFLKIQQKRVFPHVNLPTNEKNRFWRQQFSLKFCWKKLSLFLELFQSGPHSIISPETFSKQKPSSFNHRVKNASISFRIALTNLSKQNKAYLFQSKPQILCQSQRSSILVPLFNFFRFKHYGELNWNVFLKIYNTTTFWLGRFLLIHTCVSKR